MRLRLRTRPGKAAQSIFFLHQYQSLSMVDMEAQTRFYQFSVAILLSIQSPECGEASDSKVNESISSPLKQALSLTGEKVLDHFIVAGVSILNFAERGLL